MNSSIMNAEVRKLKTNLFPLNVLTKTNVDKGDVNITVRLHAMTPRSLALSCEQHIKIIYA